PSPKPSLSIFSARVSSAAVVDSLGQRAAATGFHADSIKGRLTGRGRGPSHCGGAASVGRATGVDARTDRGGAAASKCKQPVAKMWVRVEPLPALDGRCHCAALRATTVSYGNLALGWKKAARAYRTR
ncbi:unnamed protein product, partial [Urochloa humidicola]